MSYKEFIELYRGHIIKRIIKDKGWTITKASNYLSSKFMYDKYIHSIMMQIIEEDQPQIILNRNPTITFGSILLMKIRKVKTDNNDLTLSIPSSILKGLNADLTHLYPRLRSV